MPIESQLLRNARDRLARAEAGFASASALVELEEGLALLDELIESDAGERVVARNLAATYAARIFARVQAAVASDRAIPQPTLEHYFKLMLAFDAGDFALPIEARALKIAVVRRLVELAYEGYPAEAKRKALEQLGGIVDDTTDE
jgi:hypothetical protein